MSDLVPVVFRTKYRRYNAGEIAGFPADEAEQLVTQQIAERYSENLDTQEVIARAPDGRPDREPLGLLVGVETGPPAPNPIPAQSAATTIKTEADAEEFRTVPEPEPTKPKPRTKSAKPVLSPSTLRQDSGQASLRTEGPVPSPTEGAAAEPTLKTEE